MKKDIIKVFFDSNPVSSKKTETNNQKIINLLNKYGCNVIQTVMGVEFSYSEMQGKKAAFNIYNSKLKDIYDNDILVCEVSFPSPTLIFEIFEALNHKKPVLVLYDEKQMRTPDIALLGNPSNLLVLEVYNENNLEKKIADFLKKARKKISIARFTVRLTKEMSEYLNHLKAKMQCSSKNDVILEILEKMARENSGFQH